MEKQNYFKLLSDINVKGLAEKKGNFNYLSWANAWALVKEIHPTTQRVVYESEHTGLNYFTDGKTAYVKVGVVINKIEHIDFLPIMDFRNKSIPVDKITSMHTNTAIQRSTAKCIAMHGLGIAIYKGEDLVNIATPTQDEPEKVEKFILKVGDENWGKVMSWIASNKKLGLEELVKRLGTKYKITQVVKKELSKNV